MTGQPNLSEIKATASVNALSPQRGFSVPTTIIPFVWLLKRSKATMSMALLSETTSHGRVVTVEAASSVTASTTGLVESFSGTNGSRKGKFK